LNDLRAVTCNSYNELKHHYIIVMQKANKNSSASTVTMDYTLRGTDAQPSTSDAAEIQLQELRARRAERNRRYAAKKKEEWLARQRNIEHG
jgi:hypothetical protein